MPATQAELEAILHGAAVAPLGAPGYEAFDRAFLRITGSDATRWLNGMVTNSIQSLAPGEGNYNFILNAQGRIQGDCTIYREPREDETTFLLETGSSQLAAVGHILDRFIIMDDVELEPLALYGLAFVGKLAYKTLCDLALPPSASPGLETPSSPFLGRMYRGPLPVPGTMTLVPPTFDLQSYELWNTSEAAIDSIRPRLSELNVPEISPEALNAFRIYSGTPRFGIDIRDRDIPQETNQTHALHFAKGCYLGQEIVERIRSRGQVHRLLTRFRLEGDLPTSFPAPLESDGKAAGELTSAALVPLPKGPQLHALGYARREFLELKKPFTYLGGTATPAPASQAIDTN